MSWKYYDSAGREKQVAASAAIVDLSYTERTSDLAVTATSAATAQTVVSAPELTFDGATTIDIEFFAPHIYLDSAVDTAVLTLYDGATQLGNMSKHYIDGASLMQSPMIAKRRLTPSAGAHTFHIKVWRLNSDLVLHAGTGAADALMPAFVRITRVLPSYAPPSPVSGTVVDYVERTTSLTVTASLPASADTFITGTSQAYEAVPYELEFYCPGVNPANADDAVVWLVWYKGATQISKTSLASSDTGANAKANGFAKIRHTPSASTFSFIVKAFISGGNGDLLAAGGGDDTYGAAYLKVTKV